MFKRFAFIALLGILVVLAVVPALAGGDHHGGGGGHDPVTICHKYFKHGHWGHETLVVDDDAVPGHLRHGDSLGPCDNGEPEETPEATEEPGTPPVVVTTPVPDSKPVEKPRTPGGTEVFHLEFTNPEFFNRVYEVYWVNPDGVIGSQVNPEKVRNTGPGGVISLVLNRQYYPANPAYGTYNVYDRTGARVRENASVWGMFVATIDGHIVQTAIVLSNDGPGSQAMPAALLDQTDTVNQDWRFPDNEFYAVR